ncbi:hypothetical protein HYY74_06800 [Candidatus Woesearchaeota archaeon]|nr:hypothetical protein [Candidatus Woesearchaeota archaeon]
MKNKLESNEPPEELFSSINRRRAKELEALNKRLRDHILLRDSAQRGLVDEFKRQIAEKDSMIHRLTSELDNALAGSGEKDSLKLRVASLESENKKLASKGRALESGLELMQHVKEKDSQSRVQALSARIAELERLNSELSQRTDSFRPVMQPKKPDVEVLALRNKVAELEGLNRKLRDHILLRDSAERAMIEEYRQQMAQKDELLKALDSSKLESDSARFSENSALFATGLQKAQQASSILKAQIETKEDEIEKLKQAHDSKEKSYEALCTQLTAQLKERSFEVERLKAFVSQREALYQSVEAELEKEIAKKDALLRKHEVSRPAEHVIELEEQIAHSRQVITLKEAAAKRAFLDSVRLREKNSGLEADLKEVKTAFESSKQDYERLLSRLKAESDRSIKALITDYSSREAMLRAENEKLKSEVSRKQLELGEQSRKIDAAITEFRARSDQIIQLRPITQVTPAPEPAAPDTTVQSQTPRHIQTEEQLNDYAKKARALRESLFKKDRELISRENEMKRREEQLSLKDSELNTMLGVVERRFAELQQREESLSRQEQILLKQQEALNKELNSMPEAKPAEMRPAIASIKAEPEIKIAGPEPKQRPKPIVKPAIIKQAVSVVAQEQPVQQLPKEQPKDRGPLLMEELETVQRIIPIKASSQKVVPAPKQDAEIDLASQSIGYHEVDEIAAMADVALQHNTSVEQIRKSLAASGYSKESIEKAFKKMGL